jgi:predicted nucleic acid-binding protein
MKYLLDVCSLVALGLVRHEFHDRVALWTRSRRSSSLLTCSITEIGFVRIAVQATAYGLSVAQARALLLELSISFPTRTTPLSCLHG